MLLVNGGADMEFYPKNAIDLYHKLSRYNDSAELIIYPNVGHIGIIVSLSYYFQNKTTLLEDITRFIEKNSISSSY